MEFCVVIAVLFMWLVGFFINMIVFSNFDAPPNIENTYAFLNLFLWPILLPSIILILLYKRGMILIRCLFKSTYELVQFLWNY